MDAICLIAAKRTGSNHLCEVLTNVPDLAVHRELFESDGVHGLDPQSWPLLRELTGIDFASHRDPRLIAFAHEQPGAWLDALEKAARAAHKRLLIFKLLPQNLDDQLIEGEILSRPGMRIVMVVRKQIDSYVSWRKAVELGKWQGVDTTGMRLRLDAEKFEEWLDLHERWYDRWRNYLNRRFLPCPVLRYELDIDNQPPARLLRRFAVAAEQVGIALRIPSVLANQGLERQDRARALADKVSNWAEFNRDIFARGLERRAFGYPL